MKTLSVFLIPVVLVALAGCESKPNCEDLKKDLSAEARADLAKRCPSVAPNPPAGTPKTW